MRRALCLRVDATYVPLVAPAAGAVGHRRRLSDVPRDQALPFVSVTAPGSALGRGPGDEPWLCLVSSGSPPALSVVDAREHEFPLPGTAGSRAVEIASDGLTALRPRP